MRRLPLRLGRHSGAFALEFGSPGFADRNGERRDRRILILESDHHPRARHAGEVDRVPVGQSDAAMRFGLADGLWRGRAVYAVGQGGEVDPDEADGVVRSRSDGELAFGLDLFPREPRIVNIGGVPVDPSHLEDPAWRRFFLAANRGRIEGDQVSVLVVGAHAARRLVHHD